MLSIWSAQLSVLLLLRTPCLMWFEADFIPCTMMCTYCWWAIHCSLNSWLTDECMTQAEPLRAFPGLVGSEPMGHRSASFSLSCWDGRMGVWSGQRPACSPWKISCQKMKSVGWEHRKKKRQRSRHNSNENLFQSHLNLSRFPPLTVQLYKWIHFFLAKANLRSLAI